MRRIAILGLWLLASVSTAALGEDKIVSPTLNAAFLVELNELMSKQKFQDGVSLDEIRKQALTNFAKYLMVTPAEEERLKKGELDEAGNRKRMEAQTNLMDCIAVERPAFTRKFAEEWKAGTLSGLRLKLALHINRLFFEKMSQALKSPRLAEPESLIVSDTLLREMILFTGELIDRAILERKKPPEGVRVEEWKQAAMQPLVYLLFVTPEEEAQFKRGQFDDARNNSTLQEQTEAFAKAEKLNFQIPDFSKKAVNEFKAGSMNRPRMEVAVRLNQSAFEQAKLALAGK